MFWCWLLNVQQSSLQLKAYHYTVEKFCRKKNSELQQQYENVSHPKGEKAGKENRKGGGREDGDGRGSAREAATRTKMM